jgi:amidase
MSSDRSRAPDAKVDMAEGSTLPTRRGVLGGMAGVALGSVIGAPTFAKTSGADLAFVSVAEAAEAVRSRTISSMELTRLMLERIARLNPQLNAVVNVLTEPALAEALTRDSVPRSDRKGALHGVPILVKDCFEIAGVPTTAGIEQLKDYRPLSDAPVVQRLRAAGAVVLGNTNVPFVLNDWQSYNSVYGETKNPWDVTRTPGGSSGGSAAALAAGLGYLSPGSDLSGSIRVPAHFCGVYGHKPSLNVVPYGRSFPTPPGAPPELPSLLGVAGPLARSAGDLKLAMEVLGGPEAGEAVAYRWRMPVPRRERLKDYRVGYVLDDPSCPVDQPTRKVIESAIDALSAAGVQLREGWPAGIDPLAQHRTYLYLLLSGLGLPPGLNPEVLKPAALRDDGSMDSIFAQTVLDPHSRWVERERNQVAARIAWQAAFKDCDVFLAPTCFVAAFPHDSSEPQGARRLATSAGARPYLDLIFWNSFATLAGLPSTVAPVGRTEQGLPVGAQIIGPYLEDATSIDFAARMADVIGGFVPPPGYA